MSSSGLSTIRRTWHTRSGAGKGHEGDSGTGASVLWLPKEVVESACLEMFKIQPSKVLSNLLWLILHGEEGLDQVVCSANSYCVL